MSRAHDLVVLVLVVFMLMMVQYVGAEVLDPLRTELLEHGDVSGVNGERHMDDMFASVTFWVPLFGQAGAIVIVLWREYRRQKVSRVQGARI